MSAPDPSGAKVVGSVFGVGPGPEMMPASTHVGDKVISFDGEQVGKVSVIMLDIRSGHIACAVLSTGGFLGIGETLHATVFSC